MPKNLYSKFYESIYAPTPVLRQKCRVYCYYFCFSVKQRNSKGMCMISARNVPEMPSIVWTPKKPRCSVLLHQERGQRPERETSWRRPTLQAQNTSVQLWGGVAAALRGDSHTTQSIKKKSRELAAEEYYSFHSQQSRHSCIKSILAIISCYWSLVINKKV